MQQQVSIHQGSLVTSAEVWGASWEPLDCSRSTVREVLGRTLGSSGNSLKDFQETTKDPKVQGSRSYQSSVYGPDTEVQYRPWKPHEPAKPSRILSKKEADVEFQYRPHNADSNTIADAPFFADAVSETSILASNTPKTVQSRNNPAKQNAHLQKKR